MFHDEMYESIKSMIIFALLILTITCIILVTTGTDYNKETVCRDNTGKIMKDQICYKSCNIIWDDNCSLDNQLQGGARP